MSDKTTGPAGAAGTAPTVDQPGKIRNVVLVGHSGAGKTTLVEALLVASGAIPRAGRVEEGTTTTDFEDAEVRHQRSVSLALAPVEHNGVKINLLDAPGYADFVGDLRAGLRAPRRLARSSIASHPPSRRASSSPNSTPRARISMQLSAPARRHSATASCRCISRYATQPGPIQY